MNAELKIDHPKDFEKRGLALVENFLSADQVTRLNRELDELFARRSINGSMGFMQVNGNLRELVVPSVIVRSLNLLEIALDVRDLVLSLSPEHRGVNLKLTNIEVFSEEYNTKPLFWHTDNRTGMIRAQIYLTGGQPDSGAFQFMVGTHRRDYYVAHKLSSEQIEGLKDSVVDCVGSPGTLVVFDPMGFHAKHSCVKNRRTIMFEIQPDGVDYPKSDVFMCGRLLSARVIENLDFFVNRSAKREFEHGVETFFSKSKPLPILAAIHVLGDSIRSNFLRGVRDTLVRARILVSKK